MQRIHRKEITGLVAAHTLAELYAVLTRLPLRPPISPTLAWQLIETNILKHLEVIELSAIDYAGVLEHLSRLNIKGGPTYDALIAAAAIKAGIDCLVTLNPDHFRKVYPALSSQIREP